MRRNTLIAAIAATVVSAASWAGPGMGFGPGPGMGMGGGMGGGFCTEQGMASLGLTVEQRDKIAAIQAEVSSKQVELMDSMRELRTQGSPDATRYEAMAGLREQMFDLRREGRSRIEAVLTPEQRAQRRPGG